nr:nudix hydrolase 2-like isoform X2 [Nicotiana tomentosiformis]
MWKFPTGVLDEGEDIYDAAVREVKEETGMSECKVGRNTGIQWMPFEQNAAQPFVQSHELLKYIFDICSAKINGRYTGFSSVPTVTSFSRKKTYLYMNNKVKTAASDDQ